MVRAVKLDLDQLKALFQLLDSEHVHEFEHESDGTRIRVVRGAAAVVQSVAAPVAATLPTGLAPSAAPAAAALAADEILVTSPFVGTFYRAASPDTPPFVEVGATVQAGQTLCIVEAMKLMNEIEAEQGGTVLEVFVQNGKAVEFGQKLFRIKRA